MVTTSGAPFSMKQSSKANFSVLDADLGILGEERYRNFTKTGGTREPDSAQKRVQEQREANTLSVFHMSPADVPSTPKEPPPPSPDEPYDPEAPFGQPDERTRVGPGILFPSCNRCTIRVC